MKPVSRRTLLRHAGALGAMATGSTLLIEGIAAAEESPTPRVIEVVAQRFRFTPNEIKLKVGERVVLAVKSLDFTHGMNMPDFGKRVDLMPGQITRIELQPRSSGTFDFVCDNFCGEGHEDMHGRFVVSA